MLDTLPTGLGLGETSAAANSLNRRRRSLLPFYLIETLAVCFDAVLIIVASLLTGSIYYLVAFHSVGPQSIFFGVGFLSFLNFSAVLGWRAAYRPYSLADFPKQARQTTVVWLFVFATLLVIAFLFKISETYSRGATVTFFVCGWAVIILWRFVVARFLAHSLAVGSFAERKAVLLGEHTQLLGSIVLDQLARCGYTLVDQLEFGQGPGAPAHASVCSRKLINEIIEISRREPIECVFLLPSWND